MHPTAELKLFFVEADEVVACGVLDGVVILKVSLKNNLARSLAASRASGDLSEQLESALGGTEVWEAESDIGSDDTDKRDAVNIVALGYHLRADEQVEFSFVETTERAFEIFMAADRVAIEPGDARLREHAVQQLFQFF